MRVLVHPAWLAALFLLVVNDHWLKGSGVMPGWLTGKLSDFSGLVVAPVLVAAALRLESRAARLLALAFVSAPFVAIKLSRSAADGFEAAAHAVGLSCRVWADPTDLVALAVLPYAYRLMSRAPAVLPEERATWLERAGTLVGGLACVATTISPPPHGAGLLVSRCLEPEVLSRHPLAARIDCAELARDPRAAVAAASFAAGQCRGATPAEGSDLSSEFGQDCGVIVFDAPGLSPTAVFWAGIPPHELDPYSDDDDDPRNAHLFRIGDRLFIEPARAMKTLPFTGSLTGEPCAW